MTDPDSGHPTPRDGDDDEDQNYSTTDDKHTPDNTIDPVFTSTPFYRSSAPRFSEHFPNDVDLNKSLNESIRQLRGGCDEIVHENENVDRLENAKLKIENIRVQELAKANRTVLVGASVDVRPVNVVQHTVDSLVKEHKQLTRDYSTLRNDFNALKDENEDNKKEVDRLVEEKDNLSQIIRSLKENARHSKDENSKLTRELEEEREQVKEHIHTSSEFKKLHDAALAKMSLMEAASKELKSINANLVSDLAIQTTKIQEMEDELAMKLESFDLDKTRREGDFNEKLEDMTRKLAEKVESYEELKKELLAVKSQLESSHQDKEQREKELSDLKDSHSLLEKEKTDLQEYLENVRRERDDFSSQISELSGRLEYFEDANLEGIRSTNAELTNRNASILKQLKVKEDEITALKASLDEAEKRISEQLATLEESKNLARDLERLQRLHEVSEARQTNLEQELEAADSKEKELNEKLTKFIKEELILNQEKADLATTVVELEKKVEVLSTKLDQEVAKKEELTSELQKFEDMNVERILEERRDLTEKTEELEKVLAERTGELEGVKNDWSSAKATFEEQNTKFKSMVTDVKELKMMNEKLVLDSVELQKTNSSLEMKLAAESTKNNSTREAKEKLEAEKRALEGDKKKLEEQIVNLERRNARAEELEATNVKLAEDNVYLRNELNNIPSQRAFEELHDKLAIKDKQLEEVHKELQRVNGAIETDQHLFRQCETLKIQLDDKEKKLQQAEVEKTALLHEIADYEDKLEQARQDFEGYQSRVAETEALFVNEKARLDNENEAMRARLVELETLDGYPGQGLGEGSLSLWDLAPNELKDIIRNVEEESVARFVRKLQTTSCDPSRPLSPVSTSSGSTVVQQSVTRVFDSIIMTLTDARQRSDFAGSSATLISEFIHFLRSVSICEVPTETAAAHLIDSIHKSITSLTERFQRRIHQLEVSKVELRQVQSKYEKALVEVDDLKVKVTSRTCELELMRKQELKDKELIRDLASRMRKLETQYHELGVDAENKIRDHKYVFNEMSNECEEVIRERDVAISTMQTLLADIQNLERDKINLSEQNHEKQLQIEGLSRKMEHLQSDVEVLNKKYIRADRHDRYALAIVRDCLAMLDREEEFIKRLRRRNGERQKIIDELSSNQENRPPRDSKKMTSVQVAYKKNVHEREDMQDEPTAKEFIKFRHDISRRLESFDENVEPPPRPPRTRSSSSSRPSKR